MISFPVSQITRTAKEKPMAVNLLQKQRKPSPGRRFRKGHSGNPAGRPLGSRNKATLLAEALMEGEAEDITQVLIERARAGDATALKLYFERLVPPRRERAVPVALPAIAGPADIAPAMGAIAAAVGSGVLAPAEAGELTRMIEVLMRAFDRSDFDRRLRALEEFGNVARV
jgi:hypothetical protein